MMEKNTNPAGSVIARLEEDECDEAGMFMGTARVVPMVVVAPIIERLEARVAALEAERAGGKLMAFLSPDKTQFFIPEMEGKEVNHAPYRAHWMTGWLPLYAGPLHSQSAAALVGLRGCNSLHGGAREPDPCIYRMRTTDPGCTGCAERGEDQAAEAGG